MLKGLNTVLCQVADMPRAVGFYREFFGLTPAVESPYWSHFELPGGVKLGLHPPFGGGALANGAGWVLGIEVDDVAALRSALEAKGHAVAGFHDVPGGVVIDFKDPDNNPIQAIQTGITAKDLS